MVLSERTWSFQYAAGHIDMYRTRLSDPVSTKKTLLCPVVVSLFMEEED